MSHSDHAGPGFLETCDLCHDEYPLSYIIFTGKQFLCFKCEEDKTPKDSTITTTTKLYGNNSNS